MAPPLRSTPAVLADRASSGADALGEFLREETTGGKLLLLATAVALAWANIAGDSYTAVWSAVPLGGWADPIASTLHLDIDLAHWAADGLLALFFFVAGLEVKRELVVGELSDRRAATLPLFAALGGIVVPALVALVASGGAAAAHGAWAIPVATDIAFALGVLAIAGSALPSGVRVLLLSMAVIDDLIAIALIAILFTHDFGALWLLGGLALCGAWAGLWAGGRHPPAWLLWVIAIAAWICIHASGVHATVTGILLGLLTPVRPRAADHHGESPGEQLEHRFHPFSAGGAVPIFALAAAGIPLAAAGEAFSSPIARGVIAGLLVGKIVGVLGGSWLAVRLRAGTLPASVGWRDVVPVALLAGIGYTVSLLVARLSLPDEADVEAASAAVLIASLLASITAAALLRRRSGHHISRREQAAP